ncbi:MAG: exosortase U [Pirellulaceae bacterium]
MSSAEVEVATEQSEVSTPSPPERTRSTAREYLVATVVCLACLPMVWLFLRQLWRRPHYQFFPFLLVAVVYLAWKRWPAAGDKEVKRGGSAAGFLLIAGIALLAGDVVLFHNQHWLAGVSAVLVAGGLMLHFGGARAFRHLIPAWILLWIAVPPPLGQDYDLIQDLQLLTARLTSMVLDVFSVAHLLEGIVLVFPGKRLFVEEACSGIQSLFALLACTAIYAVWARRPLIPALLLLCSAVFWAVVANMLRVATVALTFSTNGVDLSSGWPHQLLGLAVFALALGLIASTDALIMFLIGPIHAPPALVRVLSRVSARAQLTNRERAYVSEDGGYLSADHGYLSPDHGYYVSDDLPYVTDDEPRKRRRRRKRSREDQADTEQDGSLVARESRLKTLLSSAVILGSWWTALAVGSVGILGMLALMLTASGMGEAQFVLEAAEQMSSEALPEKTGTWQRGEYETVERGVGSVFGQFSQFWNYESPSFASVVSVDYPFYEWHDLSVCYRGSGWKIVERRQMSGRLQDDPYISMEMVQPSGQFGYVAFDEFDSKGRPIVEPYSVLWSRVSRRIKLNPLWAFFRGRDVVELQQATFQFQVFAMKPEPWSKRELSDIQQRFIELREVVRQMLRERAGG